MFKLSETEKNQAAFLYQRSVIIETYLTEGQLPMFG